MGALEQSCLVGLAVGVMVACNAINGAGDLSVDEGEATVPPTRTDPPSDAATESAPPIATGTCTCAPAAPAGWEGPIALAESLQGSGPACDIGLVTAYKGGVPPATPPPCTPCTCGAPGVGARCDMTITLWKSGQCTAGTQCGSAAVNTSACTPITYCNSASLASAMRTVPTPVGSCTPAGGAKPAPAFEREATACSLANAPTGACEAGSACAPSPGEGTRTCIRQTGDIVCPAGPYTDQRTFYASVVDNRTCSACTCSGLCAGGGTAVYNDQSCTTQLDATGPNVCDSLPANNLAGSARVNTLPAFASCTAGGGAVAGAVAGKDPTTFCCLP